jgi:hypothetical protein
MISMRICIYIFASRALGMGAHTTLPPHNTLHCISRRWGAGVNSELLYLLHVRQADCHFLISFSYIIVGSKMAMCADKGDTMDGKNKARR